MYNGHSQSNHRADLLFLDLRTVYFSHVHLPVEKEEGMTTSCCGDELSTPYCPQCGKKNNDPRETLLDYLSRKADYYERQVKETQELPTDDRFTPEKKAARLSRFETKHFLFESWYKTLEGMG